MTTKKFLVQLFLGLGLLAVFLYIYAESNYIYNKNMVYEKATISDLFLSSLSLFLLLWLLPTNHPNKSIRWILSGLKFAVVFMVLFAAFSEAAVVDFSGLLFGPEVLYHFTWESFTLGVKQYLLPLLFLLTFLAAAGWLLIHSSNTLNLGLYRWVLLLVAASTLYLFYPFSVLGRYHAGFQQVFDLSDIEASNLKQIEQLEPLGVQVLTADKTELIAHMGNQKNLVVIYLESFSHIFTTSDRHPQLTPHINKLQAKYQSLDPYISTAKFTMDGLVSSLCGFIPNMTMGNNALNSGERNYFFLPCLPDVLKQAGYHQEFIGGAKKSFAAKDQFLQEHGFDRVWGWEDFEHEAAFADPDKHSWWGLYDDDLFEFTRQKIADLHPEKKPFHLSILTLDTHLKGFPSPSCKPYKQDADLYLQAIHCTDQLLGKFINDLDQMGVLEDTLVIISGDHSVFDTSLTRSLFGPQVQNKNLLGLIIDNNGPSTNVPMALYDLPPVILDLLAINHNLNFINGKSTPYSDSRLLLTRRQAFRNGVPLELSGDCDDESLNLSRLDKCSHADAVRKIHGYTQMFGLNKGIKYNQGSDLEVQFNQDPLAVSQIRLNGIDLKTSFKRDGFELQARHFKSADAFFIQFDVGKKTLKNTLLLNVAKNPIGVIRYLTGEADHPFVVFGNNLPAYADFITKLKLNYVLNCTENDLCVYQPAKLGAVLIDKSTGKINLIFNK